jgi:uncharacterized RDD family membrane protein YckC
VTGDVPAQQPGTGVEGRYAGFVTRAAAFVVDVVTIAVTIDIAGAVIEFLVSSISGQSFTFSQVPILSIVAIVAWAFVYCAWPLAMSGRTFGMLLFGLRAVRTDGTRLDGRHAVVRVLAFPLSFLLFGVGFLLILLRRDRRALHDLLAHTSVVYAWATPR